MKTKICAWIAVAALGAAGCQEMSEQVVDRSAGTNGGFEHTRSGLPVNWLVYSPKTIPTGSYKLGFDKKDFKEGKQSLRFAVDKCSSDGGWHSPGFCQEFPATPGTTYAIRFWIKSRGCKWTSSMGGVSAKTGDFVKVDSTAVAQGSWQRVERKYKVPLRYDRLRFELSIRSPGTLWIDDVRIEPVAGGHAK